VVMRHAIARAVTLPEAERGCGCARAVPAPHACCVPRVAGKGNACVGGGLSERSDIARSGFALSESINTRSTFNRKKITEKLLEWFSRGIATLHPF
jgi:hypothetical protein